MNMFIEQGNKGKYEYLKYLVGSVLIILGSFIGQIPLGIAVVIKSITTNKMPSTEKDIYKMFDSNIILFLILLSFVFAIVSLYLVVKYYHKQQFITIVTSRKKVDWKRFFVAFGFWAIISASIIVISYYVDPSEVEVQFKLVPFIILCLICLLFLPIQTSTEELIFRGYLMQGFYDLSKNKWFPLVMTSIIFGTLHIFNPEVQKMGYVVLVYYIGTGLFLGIITLMDEGTELALGFHAANNIVSALLITSDYTVFQTHSIFKDLSEPTVGFDILFPIVFYIFLIFIFAKIYKWNNWKEKLIGNTSKNSIQ